MELFPVLLLWASRNLSLQGKTQCPRKEAAYLCTKNLDRALQDICFWGGGEVLQVSRLLLVGNLTSDMPDTNGRLKKVGWKSQIWGARKVSHWNSELQLMSCSGRWVQETEAVIMV